MKILKFKPMSGCIPIYLNITKAPKMFTTTSPNTINHIIQQFDNMKNKVQTINHTNQQCSLIQLWLCLFS